MRKSQGSEPQPRSSVLAASFLEAPLAGGQAPPIDLPAGVSGVEQSGANADKAHRHIPYAEISPPPIVVARLRGTFRKA